MTSVIAPYGRVAWRFSMRFVLASLLCVGAVSAQTPQPGAPKQAPPPTPSTTKPPVSRDLPAEKPAKESDLPAARSIIDRHIKAIGGRAAILAHKSTHAVGTISMPATGITGPIDVYAAAPDKSFVKISLGGVGDLLEGYDGTHGWTLQPMMGPMLKQGKELAEKKFDSDYYSDLHESERYASMKTVEKTTFEGRPCYKVSLIRKDGGEEIEYYDAETGLRAGTIQTRETPMGPMTATQVLSDYKKFGALLVPTTMKQTALNVEQVLKVTSVEFDNVPPSTFDLPAQIKALIK